MTRKKIILVAGGTGGHVFPRNQSGQKIERNGPRYSHHY